MNAGLHELPLVFFTIFTQSAVGAWLVFCFVLYHTKNEKSKDYIHKAIFVILAFLGIGFMASIAHLGDPIRAFNSLNRIGSSMISNEIATGMVFFALSGSYWVMALIRKIPPIVENSWRLLTALSGIVFMYTMSQVYHLPSVPTWNTNFTYWSFFLTIILGGLVLAYALLIPNKQRDYQLKWVPNLFVLALLFTAIITIYHSFSLHDIHSAIQNASALVPHYAQISIIRLCLLSISALLLFRTQNPKLLVCIVFFTLISEGLGRILFYGLHMTSGMAI